MTDRRAILATFDARRFAGRAVLIVTTDYTSERRLVGESTAADYLSCNGHGIADYHIAAIETTDGGPALSWSMHVGWTHDLPVDPEFAALAEECEDGE